MRYCLLLLVLITPGLLWQTTDLAACENCIKKQTVTKLEQKIEVLKKSGAPEQVIEQAQKKLLETKKLVVKEKKSILGYDAVSREFFVFLDGNLKQVSGPWQEPKEVLEMKTPFVNYSGPGIKVGNAQWGTWDAEGNWRWFYREIDQKDVMNPNVLKQGELPPWFIEDQKRAKAEVAQKSDQPLNAVTQSVLYLKQQRFLKVKIDDEQNPQSIEIRVPYTTRVRDKSSTRQALFDLSRLVGLRELKEITLIGLNEYDQLHYLSLFPRLESLSLIDMYISDKDKKAIASLTQLHSLYLDRTQIHQHLKDLKQFSNLKKLHLRNHGLSEDDLVVLGELTQLQVLDLTGNSTLNDVALFHLRNMKNLEVLKLESSGKFTEKGLKYLQEHQKLKTLDLMGCLLVSRRLDLLERFTDLQSLRLKIYTGERVDARILSSLQHMQGLKYLEVDMTSLQGGFGLSVLSKLPHLEELHFVNSQLNDDDLQWVARCSALKSFTVHSSRITDKGIARLSSLRNLESLNLDRCSIRGSGLADLGVLKHLKEMSLNHNYVNDSFVSAITELNSLETLSLRGGRFTSQTLKAIKDHPQLSRLSLIHCRVTDEDCLYFKQMPSLKHLELDSTVITNIGLEDLKQATQLETLSIRSTSATRQGVERLQAALVDCQITY
ncbi:Internalin-A precursor [Gimesia chilikensis]|uniref:Internalin-A n=1 Tax=Gimesia chilikensis TaxID=2605989 RepID=A0A517WAQ7_9PLAN|nr:hypothetical protein [Gimesia chilikensis]QDU02337.1 Internalin-A precursor [Gimesia chilikensis]